MTLRKTQSGENPPKMAGSDETKPKKVKKTSFSILENADISPKFEENNNNPNNRGNGAAIGMEIDRAEEDPAVDNVEELGHFENLTENSNGNAEEKKPGKKREEKNANRGKCRRHRKRSPFLNSGMRFEMLIR